jgi:hypothetical protein
MKIGKVRGGGGVRVMFSLAKGKIAKTKKHICISTHTHTHTHSYLYTYNVIKH